MHIEQFLYSVTWNYALVSTCTYIFHIAHGTSPLCSCCFSFSRQILPRPLRLPSLDFAPSTLESERKRQTDKIDSYRERVARLRVERKVFKNVSVCLGYEPQFEPATDSELEPHIEPSLKDGNTSSHGDQDSGDGTTAPLRQIQQALLAHPDNPDKFISILADILGVGSEEIKQNLDCLLDLGLDSLAAMQMIDGLNTEFRIRLPILFFLRQPRTQMSNGKTLSQVYSDAKLFFEGMKREFQQGSVNVPSLSPLALVSMAQSIRKTSSNQGGARSSG